MHINNFEYQQLIASFSGLTNDQHTISIESSGHKNPLSTDYEINLDAFANLYYQPVNVTRTTRDLCVGCNATLDNVAFQEEKRYSFVAEANKVYAITLTSSDVINGSGNSDLYGATDGNFTRANAQQYSTNEENQNINADTIIYPALSSGLYYIIVYGTSQANFNLSVTTP